MIAMTKEEFATYLRDYSIMSELIRNHQQTSIRQIFQNFMITNGRFEDNNPEYFVRMIRSYSTYVIMKSFSYYEDLQINRLKDEELHFDEIKESIFVNKEDNKYFSKKSIIKFIRNAFNHSDADKELYKISKNGKFIEIYLSLDNYIDRNGNRKIPVPFHIKISMEQLEKINTSLIEAGQNLLMSDFKYERDFDLNRDTPEEAAEKIKFRHYYFDKKIPADILDKISTIGEVEDVDSLSRKQKIAQIENVLKKEKYNIQEFSLDKFQKKRAIEYFTIIKKLMAKSLEPLGENYYKNVTNYCMSKLIPLGMYHYEQVIYEYLFSVWYMRDIEMTFESIKNQFDKICFYNSEEMEYSTNFVKERTEAINDIWATPGKKQILALFSTDTESRRIYPLLMYCDFVINNMSKDEYIQIGDKYIPRERIRNSLVHGRWYIGTNNNIEFYDCPNGNNNDYNFNFHETINIKELQNYVESIYKKVSVIHKR